MIKNEIMKNKILGNLLLVIQQSINGDRSLLIEYQKREKNEVYDFLSNNESIDKNILLYSKRLFIEDDISKEEIMDINEYIHLFLKKEMLDSFEFSLVTLLFCAIMKKYGYNYKLESYYETILGIKEGINKNYINIIENEKEETINEIIVYYFICIKNNMLSNKVNINKILNSLIKLGSKIFYNIYYEDLKILNINVRKKINKLIKKKPFLLEKYIKNSINLLNPECLNFIDICIEKNTNYPNSKDLKRQLLGMVDKYRKDSSFPFKTGLCVEVNETIHNDEELFFNTEADFIKYIYRIMGYRVNEPEINSDQILDINKKINYYNKENEKDKNQTTMKNVLTLEYLNSIKGIENYFLCEEIKKEHLKEDKIMIFRTLLKNILKGNHLYDLIKDDEEIIIDFIEHGYRGNWYIFCGISTIFEKIIRKIILKETKDKKTTKGFKSNKGMYQDIALSSLLRENAASISNSLSEGCIQELNVLFGENLLNLRNRYCHGLIENSEEDNKKIMYLYPFTLRFFLTTAYLK